MELIALLISLVCVTIGETVEVKCDDCSPPPIVVAVNHDDALVE